MKLTRQHDNPSKEGTGHPTPNVFNNPAMGLSYINIYGSMWGGKSHFNAKIVVFKKFLSVSL